MDCGQSPEKRHYSLDKRAIAKLAEGIALIKHLPRSGQLLSVGIVSGT